MNLRAEFHKRQSWQVGYKSVRQASSHILKNTPELLVKCCLLRSNRVLVELLIDVGVRQHLLTTGQIFILINNTNFRTLVCL